MQTLVIAHARGCNHFFKNNYLFKLWTDAEGILDYLNFAKSYIGQCEERHGQVAVERTLDAAHALMTHGVTAIPARRSSICARREARARAPRHEERVFNDLWRIPGQARARAPPSDVSASALLGLPQENILYFLEKSAPRLQPWQRELLRIVRHIAQYFYPRGRPRS